MPGSVELLASFTEDIQNIGNVDSEIVKNCEVFDVKVYFLKKKEYINVSALHFGRQI